MSKKQKWGLLVFLLPVPHLPHLTEVADPRQKGDRVPGSFFNRLVHQTPVTVPFTLLQHRRMALDVHSSRYGTLLAIFPQLRPLQQHATGRVHLLVVTAVAAALRQAIVSGDRNCHHLRFPLCSGGEVFRSLTTGSLLPQLLYFSADGVLAALTEGYYLTGATLHQLKKNPKRDLVLRLAKGNPISSTKNSFP